MPVSVGTPSPASRAPPAGAAPSVERLTVDPTYVPQQAPEQSLPHVQSPPQVQGSHLHSPQLQSSQVQVAHSHGSQVQESHLQASPSLVTAKPTEAAASNTTAHAAARNLRLVMVGLPLLSVMACGCRTRCQAMCRRPGMGGGTGGWWWRDWAA